MTPYEARSIRFLDLWGVEDWRIKLYGIAYALRCRALSWWQPHKASPRSSFA